VYLQYRVRTKAIGLQTSHDGYAAADLYNLDTLTVEVLDAAIEESDHAGLRTMRILPLLEYLSQRLVTSITATGTGACLCDFLGGSMRDASQLSLRNDASLTGFCFITELDGLKPVREVRTFDRWIEDVECGMGLLQAWIGHLSCRSRR
jgi:hypothetical protein